MARHLQKVDEDTCPEEEGVEEGIYQGVEAGKDLHLHQEEGIFLGEEEEEGIYRELGVAKAHLLREVDMDVSLEVGAEVGRIYLLYQEVDEDTCLEGEGVEAGRDLHLHQEVDEDIFQEEEGIDRGEEVGAAEARHLPREVDMDVSLRVGVEAGVDISPEAVVYHAH